MTRLVFPFLALLMLIIACQPAKNKEQTNKESSDSLPATTPASAVLSEAEKAEGWIRLFDGQSMAGWRPFKNKENASWEVKDGALHCLAFDNRKIKENTDLLTNDQYENFELSLEWKIASQGNSGIIYRATEEFDAPFLSGPEYQTIDDIGYPGELKATNKTGGDYDMYEPGPKTLKPVGEWNSTKIVVNGNHVEHWLNGNKVLEYELGSADWRKRKAAGKWKDAAGYGAARKGHIDLQDHGDEVWYRNILLRPI